MQERYASDVAFSSAVKSVQERLGSRTGYSRMEKGRGWQTAVTPDLADFLAGLDMFYLGTANAEGQPYIQYRGGAPGFLKIIDEHTLGFADFGGNRQYITVGNLSENPRAFIFLMDYVNQRRVKLWGIARAVEDDAALFRHLEDPSYDAPVERAIVFVIEAWDANCQQHIHRRLSAGQVAKEVDGLQRRITELEAQLRGTSCNSTRGARRCSG